MGFVAGLLRTMVENTLNNALQNQAVYRFSLAGVNPFQTW